MMNIRRDEPLKFRNNVYRTNKHKLTINSASKIDNDF